MAVDDDLVPLLSDVRLDVSSVRTSDCEDDQARWIKIELVDHEKEEKDGPPNSVIANELRILPSIKGVSHSSF